MTRKSLIFASLLMLALAVGGCTSLTSFAASTAAFASSELPAQVTTLNEALLAADLVVKATKTAVDTDKLDLGTLTELQALRAGVRAALDVQVAAHDRGENLNFTVFNAALGAYRAYTAQKGIAT